MAYLKAHFQKYRTRKPFDFLWRITLEGLLVSIVVAVICYSSGSDEIEMPVIGFWTFSFLVVIIAPIAETLVLQAAPIEAMRFFKANLALQIFVSAVVFAIPHFTGGVGKGFTSGMAGGLYLAFTYAHWRGKSWWAATWITAASHAIRNLIAIAIMVVGGDVPGH